MQNFVTNVRTNLAPEQGNQEYELHCAQCKAESKEPENHASWFMKYMCGILEDTLKKVPAPAAGGQGPENAKARKVEGPEQTRVPECDELAKGAGAAAAAAGGTGSGGK